MMAHPLNAAIKQTECLIAQAAALLEQLKALTPAEPEAKPAPESGEKTCPKCGSKELAGPARTLTGAAFVCVSCGTNVEVSDG